MTLKISIIEADPNSREFIQWEGDFNSVTKEMLDLFQDRTGQSDERITELRNRIYKGITPEVRCQNLTAIMNASSKYRYFWQVMN